MKNLAIVFSGQGSQYVGMGKALFEEHQIVRELFEQASDTLHLDMQNLCFEASADELNSTENTQPALLLCSVAAWQVFQQQTGLTPSYMAGHSLGELSALVAAGAMSVDTGLKLARSRGLAMSHCGNDGLTGMSAVTKLSREHLDKLYADFAGFGEKVVVANYNSPRQQVLSGDKALLSELGDTLKAEGATVIPLRVSGAFHSPFMAKAAEDFAQQLAEADITAPQIPVISNVTAQPHTDAASLRDLLVQQITAPVRWQDSLDFLAEAGINHFVEAGPKDVLKKLTATTLPNVKAFATDKAEDDKPMLEALAAPIRAAKTRPSVLGKCLAVAVATRNTNWDNTAYQTEVVQPYQKLKSLHETHQQEGGALADEQVSEAIQLLRQIMTCKGASIEEQSERLQQVASQTGSQQVAALLD